MRAGNGLFLFSSRLAVENSASPLRTVCHPTASPKGGFLFGCRPAAESMRNASPVCSSSNVVITDRSPRRSPTPIRSLVPSPVLMQEAPGGHNTFSNSKGTHYAGYLTGDVPPPVFLQTPQMMCLSPMRQSRSPLHARHLGHCPAPIVAGMHNRSHVEASPV